MNDEEKGMLPQFLTSDQVSAIFRDRLAALEALHLHALINQRIEQSHQGTEAWDVHKGQALLVRLQEDWQAVLDGMARAGG